MSRVRSLKFIRPFAIGMAGILIALGFVTTTFSENAEAATAGDFDFAACVENQGVGSVMILMDESGTVYGANGQPPSDPDNLRIAGTEILIDDLQTLADQTGSEINVNLAGFGDNFISRTGEEEWAQLTAQRGSTNTENLKRAARDAFESRPTDGNEIETDFWTAISGARDSFEQVDGCKLLVMFKDGFDFQVFDKDASSEFAIEEVNELLEKRFYSASVEAAELAVEDLCRPQGLADGLRADDIFTVSVGLGEGDFGQLESFTENPAVDCGEREGYGALLRAEEPGDLVNIFSRTLDPSFTPATFTSNFNFEMSQALTSINIVTSGMSPFDRFFISPPTTCTTSNAQEFDRYSAQGGGEFAPGVTWKGTSYGEGEALKVLISRDFQELGTEECWSGTWEIDPGTRAQSSVTLDADLEPFAFFEDDRDTFTIGQQNLDFQSLLRRSSSPNQTGQDGFPGLTQADLDSSIRINMQGGLFDRSGRQVVQAYQSELGVSDLGTLNSISLPDNIPVGSYTLRLNLGVDVEGLDIDLRDVSWERSVSLEGAIPIPISEGKLSFGDIIGREEATGVFEISSVADEELFFDLDQIELVTFESPQGASGYQLVSEQDTFRLEPNATTEFEVGLAPMTDEEVRFAGPISGEILIPLRTEDGEIAGSYIIPVEFSANQIPDENLLIKILAVALLMLLGALLTAGALWLVGYRISRFPKESEIWEKGLQSVTIPVDISESSITLRDTIPDISDQRWSQIDLDGRKTARLGELTLRATSPGLSLAGTGYAQLSDSSKAGWGSSGDSIEFSSKDQIPRMGLGLQSNYLVSIERADLPEDGQLTSSIPGTITLVSNIDSLPEQLDRIVEDASRDANEIVPSILGSSKPSKPRKKKKADDQDSEDLNSSFQVDF